MTTTPTKLMAHMIAGFPNVDTARKIARGLVRGGAHYLEVQFPFSDPSSDGPLIEKASQAALDNGFRVADGFAFMKELSRDYDVPLFIMTYGSLVFARGAGAFCDQAKDAGVTGLIIPDLPPDYSEGLFDEGKKRGLAIVPVISPGISDARLDILRALQPEYIYTALRLGITGSATHLDDATIAYLEKVKALGAKIIAGFGVRSAEMMHLLAGHADAAAVGSYFLEVYDKAEGDVESALSEAAKNLLA
ncbi:MAG: tryptophan synthase subunit alpha [Planctomycetes bacterium]|nr:tryptophan synthase subunit alpha [Planctomycetota bacterium]